MKFIVISHFFSLLHLPANTYISPFNLFLRYQLAHIRFTQSVAKEALDSVGALCIKYPFFQFARPEPCYSQSVVWRLRTARGARVLIGLFFNYQSFMSNFHCFYRQFIVGTPQIGSFQFNDKPFFKCPGHSGFVLLIHQLNSYIKSFIGLSV